MKKTIKYLFYLSVLFEILWGAHAWFTWNLSGVQNLHKYYVVIFILFLISWVYKNIFKISFKKNKNVVLAGIAFFIASLFMRHFEISLLSPILILMSIYPALVLASDRENIEPLKNFLSKSLAFILIPGIILYFYFRIIGYPISFLIEFPGNDVYIFYNYLFIIRGVLYNSDGLKFQSIFLEPGYLGTLLAFMLYLNAYKIKKWYNFIMLVSLILSFSLAGYVTAIIGYGIKLFVNKVKVHMYIMMLTAFLISYFIFSNYNNGDNIVNEFFFERLQYDKDKGIKGNNRSLGELDFYYSKFYESGEIWLGVPQSIINNINGKTTGRDDGIAGAGYKVFFINYGIVSAIIFFFFYYYLAKKRIKEFYIKGFLILVVLTFLQASYPTSFSWIVPYIMCCKDKQKSYLLEKL